MYQRFLLSTHPINLFEAMFLELQALPNVLLVQFPRAMHFCTLFHSVHPIVEQQQRIVRLARNKRINNLYL
jgi:hypothetical protein